MEDTSIKNMLLSYACVHMIDDNTNFHIGATSDFEPNSFIIVIDTDIDSYTTLKNRVTGKTEQIASGDYSFKDDIIQLILAYPREADLQKDIPYKAFACKNRTKADENEIETFDCTNHLTKDEFLKISIYAEKAMIQSNDISALNDWKTSEIEEDADYIAK